MSIGMKKRVCSLVILSMMILCFTACGTDSGKSAKPEDARQDTSSQENGRSQNTEAPQAAETPAADTSAGESGQDLLKGKHHVTIEVKDYGTIAVELDADAAPVTVTNFINLANQKFYDGLTFHRIISGFMIQGGDPKGDGTGGSEETIKGEFQSNGVSNTISHKRGVISMARSTDNDSASSQFFIVHQDSDFLDGEYAAFGNVTEGIEVVDRICQNTQVVDEDGTVLAKDQPKITKITVVD